MQQDFMDYAQMRHFNFQWTYKLWTQKLSVDFKTFFGYINIQKEPFSGYTNIG